MISAAIVVPAVVRAGPLSATYDVVQCPNGGNWVAIGSIVSDDRVAQQPPWIIVGVGATRSDAIARLEHELGREAMRLASYSADRSFHK